MSDREQSRQREPLTDSQRETAQHLSTLLLAADPAVQRSFLSMLKEEVVVEDYLVGHHPENV